MVPLVQEITPAPDSEAAFVRLQTLPHCLFLDSAQREADRGRYSFLAADPFEVLEITDSSQTGLTQLQALLTQYQSHTIPGLPPFQGGAAGLLSYDLCHSLERVPASRFDEFQVPAMSMALYDVVLAIDHQEHRAWVISQGFPATDPQQRARRAKQRLDSFVAHLSGHQSLPAKQPVPCRTLKISQLAPSFTLPDIPGITSNFSAEGYQAAVQIVIDYITAGDAFQVNLSQRLLAPATSNSLELYLRLRHCNPAPFAGYYDLGEFQIISASPERFVEVKQGEVEARPIKGTRRRMRLAEADLYAGDELLQSEKDRSENMMIVDLLRNDISPVCQDDSVYVSQLCGLETYQFVQHLVSVVRGKLAPGRGALELVQAAFPGGSITGAPKVRAMEIIAELEPTARGAYCGSLGYIGFDGTLDLNILIRTITAGRGWWQFPVGGGVVANSNPRREYEETWNKAEGLLRAVLS